MGGYRVTISGTLFEIGVQCQTVLNVHRDAGPHDLEEIAAEFHTNYINSMRNLQAAVFRYDYITVRNMSTPGLATHVHSIAPAILGVSSANIFHPSICPIIRLATATISKTGKGRIYIPGVFTTGITRTRPSTTLFNAFNTHKPALMRYAQGGASLYTMMVAPRNWDGSSGSAWFVRDMLMAPVCGIQRRRNELVGI